MTPARLNPVMADPGIPDSVKAAAGSLVDGGLPVGLGHAARRLRRRHGRRRWQPGAVDSHRLGQTRARERELGSMFAGAIIGQTRGALAGPVAGTKAAKKKREKVDEPAAAASEIHLRRRRQGGCGGRA